MFFTSYLLWGFTLLSLAFASPTGNSGLFKAHVAKRFQDPSLDKIVSTYLSMVRHKFDYISPLQDTLRRRSVTAGVAPTTAIDQTLAWVTKIQVAGNDYYVGIDTGSSDTWIAAKDFKCFDYESAEPLDMSFCQFGPVYTPASDFAPVLDQIFVIRYGDGRFLSGVFSHVDVTLAGISVNQQIGIATEAGCTAAFNISDGLYNKSDDQSRVEHQIPYDPIFTTMYKSEKIAPVFSLAISRATAKKITQFPSCDGYLALGGLPPVKTYGKWARSPIEYVALDYGYYPTSLPYPQFEWYTILAEDFLIQRNPTATYGNDQWAPLPKPATLPRVQIIIDSGTTLDYLPGDMAFLLAAAYQPPAVWDPEMRVFFVACEAIPPRFAIKIAGVIFEVDPRDMINDEGDGTCITTHLPGNPAYPYVIGDVFLRNVLVVFDVGAGELRIRSRGRY
ncbi:aspartic-type [Phlyctema vagabunda]|uniref:Aspartic-type n=1 Tax=Phlyctema vagabunda TaxID=108571 RepID=A0ABR4PI89_9HELO